MNETARERLLAAVSAANQSAPVTFDKPLSVEAGQVRRLRSYDDDLDTMLVLVLRVDEDSSAAKVIGVGSPIDEATTRDLVVTRSVVGFPFDLFLRIDGVATAWSVQLSGTPVVGFLPGEVVDLAHRAPQLTTQDLAHEAGAKGISTGILTPQTGDPLWWQIGMKAEHLARLTDACHEAMLSRTIADPAILPSLILRGDEPDLVAAVALHDAIDSELAEFSQESLDSCSEALSRDPTRNQDAWRLLEKFYLEDVLRYSATGSDAPSEPVEGPTASPARGTPAGLPKDPLDRLVARCAQEGERCTRVWTFHHLWKEPSTVFHTRVGPHRHAILAEFDVHAEVRS